jgi:hypothetical protein
MMHSLAMDNYNPYLRNVNRMLVQALNIYIDLKLITLNDQINKIVRRKADEW